MVPVPSLADELLILCLHAHHHNFGSLLNLMDIAEYVKRFHGDIDWPHHQSRISIGDNGRGMHWVPTTKQDKSTVDRFVAEAQRMGVKWVTFLNDGANIGDNDYLVSKLAAAGIEPVMRLYSATLEPLQGDIEGMVRHYTAMGVHYFQPFNEPNLICENPDGKVSVDRYLNAWIPAAKAIVRGGGLPGCRLRPRDADGASR